jgi:hypothetical protein
VLQYCCHEDLKRDKRDFVVSAPVLVRHLACFRLFQTNLIAQTVDVLFDCHIGEVPIIPTFAHLGYGSSGGYDN